nr:unnamed protein product [Callosobruchus chinensis]
MYLLSLLVLAYSSATATNFPKHNLLIPAAGKIEGGRRGIGRKKLSWLRNIRQWTEISDFQSIQEAARNRNYTIGKNYAEICMALKEEDGWSGRQALPRSHSFKLVGVSITENMIWHEHVSSIATAAGKKLGYLFRARKYFSPFNLLTLHKAQIRTSLE